MKKIDLTKIKYGEKLWTPQLGDCVLHNIDNDQTYSHTLMNMDGTVYPYTKDGYNTVNDEHPSVFMSNPNTACYPKNMLVWDDDKKTSKREAIVVLKTEDFYYALPIQIKNIEDIEKGEYDITLIPFKFAEDIQQPLELTIEEVASRLGVQKVVIVECVTQPKS